jgi:hypothetical protein
MMKWDDPCLAVESTVYVQFVGKRFLFKPGSFGGLWLESNKQAQITDAAPPVWQSAARAHVNHTQWMRSKKGRVARVK